MLTALWTERVEEGRSDTARDKLLHTFWLPRSRSAGREKSLRRRDLGWVLLGRGMCLVRRSNSLGGNGIHGGASINVWGVDGDGKWFWNMDPVLGRSVEVVVGDVFMVLIHNFEGDLALAIIWSGFTGCGRGVRGVGDHGSFLGDGGGR